MEYIDEIISLKEQIAFDGKINIENNFENIVVAGMGGSGIAGNIFSQMYSKKPVHVIRSYEIPEFVDRSTLFIAVSYSGNTEETIKAVKRAKENGASIAAVTTGGKLAEIVENTVLIPSGFQPRSAVGFLTMHLLNAFDLVLKEDVIETIHELENIDNNTKEFESIASVLFAGNKVPFILGTPDTEAISYRWKTQFNENSKILAFNSNFPELNHNETMPFRMSYRRDEFHFFVLTTRFTQDIIKKRIELTSKLCGLKFQSISGRGHSYLSNLFTLIHIGDYISYFLGKERGIDPRNVSIIEELKRDLNS
ncbi:MAG: bifunctional phosphoglucose/phosphomannose isomerase [Thermoplasmatales archaeon]